MKHHSLINKIQSQILNPLSVFSCWLYCDWFFINKCKKSFISKPAFLNFVPQLIRKIYFNLILQICMHNSSAGTCVFNEKIIVGKGGGGGQIPPKILPF